MGQYCVEAERNIRHIQDLDIVLCRPYPANHFGQELEGATGSLERRDCAETLIKDTDQLRVERVRRLDQLPVGGGLIGPSGKLDALLGEVLVVGAVHGSSFGCRFGFDGLEQSAL